MLGDVFNFPDPTHADVQVFGPTSGGAGTGWATWHKRKGATVVYIACWGGGGAGGSGVVGANSTAAGGGGGGSGSQAVAIIPAFLLPDILFVSVGHGGGWATAGLSGQASRVAIYPDTSANNCVLLGNGGGAGGNGSGATGGTSGVGGTTPALSSMPLAGVGQWQGLAGQGGATGGGAGSGNSVTIPTTGLWVTSGAGGGGCPAAGVNGTSGGSINGGGIFPNLVGGASATSATTPGGRGLDGYGYVVRGLQFSYGGTGGGGSNGSATGAGLFGGKGGNGGPGCGGGGGGGCLTGGTAGTGGNGGGGQVIIIAW